MSAATTHRSMIQDSVRDEMDTEDGTTPRPWTCEVEVEDGAETAIVNIPSYGPGRYRWSNAIYSDNAQADAALIVEAVNSYERLRAIEAAARRLLLAVHARNPDHLSARWRSEEQDQEAEDAWAALRAALTPEADAPSERAELEETGR